MAPPSAIPISCAFIEECELDGCSLHAVSRRTLRFITTYLLKAMPDEFKPGDLVQPLSGGQVMSVTRIINDRVEVKWMANCNIQVKSFDPEVLKKVEPEHR